MSAPATWRVQDAARTALAYTPPLLGWRPVGYPPELNTRHAVVDVTELGPGPESLPRHIKPVPDRRRLRRINEDIPQPAERGSSDTRQLKGS